jgi:hypothetical protein
MYCITKGRCMPTMMMMMMMMMKASHVWVNTKRARSLARRFQVSSGLTEQTNAPKRQSGADWLHLCAEKSLAVNDERKARVFRLRLHPESPV